MVQEALRHAGSSTQVATAGKAAAARAHPKQTLRDDPDFLGHNAHAVRWQVWTALLLYLLLRFVAFVSQWGHSFTRLFTLLSSARWQRLEIRSLLEVYGTAGGGGRFLGTPQQAYLPGLA